MSRADGNRDPGIRVVQPRGLRLQPARYRRLDDERRERVVAALAELLAQYLNERASEDDADAAETGDRHGMNGTPKPGPRVTGPPAER